MIVHLVGYAIGGAIAGLLVAGVLVVYDWRESRHRLDKWPWDDRSGPGA